MAIVLELCGSRLNKIIEELLKNQGTFCINSYLTDVIRKVFYSNCVLKNPKFYPPFKLNLSGKTLMSTYPSHIIMYVHKAINYCLIQLYFHQ